MQACDVAVEPTGTLSLGAHFLPYRRYPGWLGRETAAALLDYARDHVELFKSSKIRRDAYAGVDETTRVSERTSMLGPFRDLIRQRALDTFPEVCAAFGTPLFTPQDIEIELVAHGDGAFFSCHNDTISGEHRPQWPRRVTMVYYLHALPKAFTGGNLRYYSLDRRNFIEIEAACDEMVSFPSWAPHSVERVCVPGGAFMDRRFAVDIWIKG